jgi:hypothetical protein
MTAGSCSFPETALLGLPIFLSLVGTPRRGAGRLLAVCSVHTLSPTLPLTAAQSRQQHGAAQPGHAAQDGVG